MEAYANAERTPARLELIGRQVPVAAVTTETGTSRTRTPPATSAPSRRTSPTLASLFVDELDDQALTLLAHRLGPYLTLLQRPAPTCGRIAYTVLSLAAEIGVSPKAIRCAIARGELQAVKRGARWIISAQAVDQWTSTPRSRPVAPGRGRVTAPKAAGPSLRSVLCADASSTSAVARRAR